MRRSAPSRSGRGQRLAYTSLSAATNRQGQLPGSRTCTLKLPGQAAGSAELFEALNESDGVWYYTVEARFTAATELNNFIVGLDLPLDRFLGTTVRSVRGESQVALSQDTFGATISAPALVELGGGQALYCGPTSPSAMEVFDSRRFQGTTVQLRLPAGVGKLPAGTVVRKTIVIAQTTADQAVTLADQVAPQASYDPEQDGLPGQRRRHHRTARTRQQASRRAGAGGPWPRLVVRAAGRAGGHPEQ